jgi:hypothetical protein
MATTTNTRKPVATRTIPAVKQAKIALPCGHDVWVKVPSANRRVHCDRTFLTLIDGDELIVRESIAK